MTHSMISRTLNNWKKKSVVVSEFGRGSLDIIAQMFDS